MSKASGNVMSSSDLAELYDSLNESAKQSLSDFASYLASTTELVSKEVPEPAEIPRPEDETVVGAIKRLKSTYFMVESMSVFSKASSLMTEHMMNGRDSIEVIDEMEEVFLTAYQEMLQDKQD